MTPETFKLWAPLLKECGVQSFRNGDFEITFFPPANAQPAQTTQTESKTVDESNIKTEKIEDVVVPQSLEEEPGMSFDQVLNWSVESNSPVPLTGTGE